MYQDEQIKLNGIISVWEGNIIEAPERLRVDAIVNSAKPTLMGSDTNVDGAIHKKIDEIRKEEGFFKAKIIEEFNKKGFNSSEKTLRCSRGEAVMTEGYGLCKAVIHTVGPKSDKGTHCFDTYSSSCVETLNECYRNVLKIILDNPEIERVAIPVVSSGNYGFDFDYAFKIGITALYNALLDRKKKCKEFFQYINLKKIYFVVSNQNNYYQRACKILKSYESVFEKEHRAVARGAWQSQREFWNEIKCYDEQRGYFAIAKLIRQMLMILRITFGFWTFLKDIISKKDWVYRRQTVEIIVFLKVLIPLFVMHFMEKNTGNKCLIIICLIAVFYNMLDTITYLIALMLLADIQRPSANVIRSLVLLIVNWVEVKFEIAVGYFVYGNYFNQSIKISGAIKQSFTKQLSIGGIDYVWLDFINTGISFFFLTIALTYLLSHMRLREFRVK